jgi:hypothetical protein
MSSVQRLAIAVTVAALAATAAGCGSDGEEGTPSACLDPAAGYMSALASAPSEVRLGGETPISACLVEGQPAGEISQIGASLIKVATSLNAEGRRDPTGSAPIELGYLIGAVEKGAADTSGIHQDLVLRLESAARFSPGGSPLPSAFQQGFGRGFSAGQETG